MQREANTGERHEGAREGAWRSIAEEHARRRRWAVASYVLTHLFSFLITQRSSAARLKKRMTWIELHILSIQL